MALPRALPPAKLPDDFPHGGERLAPLFLFATLLSAWGHCQTPLEEEEETPGPLPTLELAEERLGVGEGLGWARPGCWVPLVFSIENETPGDFVGDARIAFPLLNQKREPIFRTRRRFEIRIPSETARRYECYVRAVTDPPGESYLRPRTAVELGLRSGYRPFHFNTLDLQSLADNELLVLEVRAWAVPFRLGQGRRILGDRMGREAYVKQSGRIVKRKSIARERNWQEVASRPEQMPRSWIGYSSVDCVVWDDASPGKLSPGQRTALVHFVQSGGHLFVFSGRHWQNLRDSELGELLPLRSLRSKEVTFGTEGEKLIICEGDLKPGAARMKIQAAETTVVVPRGPDGNQTDRQDHRIDAPALVRWRCGAGSVSFFPFASDDPAGKRVKKSTLFWMSVLRRSQNPASYDRGHKWGRNVAAFFAEEDRLNIPPRQVIGWFLLAYLVLVVPANYVVFRLLERLTYAWVMSPCLAVVFAVAAYQYDTLASGGVEVRIANLVQVAPGSDIGVSRSYISLFSPHTTRYEVEVEGLDFSFTHLETETAFYDPTALTNSGTPTLLDADKKTEEMVLRGDGAGTVTELKIRARTRRNIQAVGLVPLDAETRKMLSKRTADSTGLKPRGSARRLVRDLSKLLAVREEPFLPIVVEGRRIAPFKEVTLFHLPGLDRREARILKEINLSDF